MADEKKKSKKAPVVYILNGQEYQVKAITFEVLCADVASRKDKEAKAFLIANKDKNFLSVRKEYLEKWGKKAQTDKEKALALLDW